MSYLNCDVIGAAPHINRQLLQILITELFLLVKSHLIAYAFLASVCV